MEVVATLARWEMILLIPAFAVVTLYRLFQSANFAGLLRAGDGTFSPGRAQMLLLTVFTALQYLLETIHDPTHLPPISSNLVMALGGSHAVYLGAKAWGIFGPKNRS